MALPQLNLWAWSESCPALARRPAPCTVAAPWPFSQTAAYSWPAAAQPTAASLMSSTTSANAARTPASGTDRPEPKATQREVAGTHAGAGVFGQPDHQLADAVREMLPWP